MIGEFSGLLSEGWVQATLAMVLSLAAAVLSIFLYFKSKRFSKLSCTIVDTAVLGIRNDGFNDELEVRFKGRVVSRVTATLAVLWNTGNETILGDQIVDSDKLRIVTHEPYKILQVDLVDQSRSAIKSKVAINAEENECNISFDFLDAKDGIVLQIVHTAETGGIDLTGTIRGIPNGLSWFKRRSVLPAIFFWTIIGFTIGMVPTLIPDLNRNIEGRKGEINSLPVSLVVMLFMLTTLIAAYLFLRMSPSLRIFRSKRFPKIITDNSHLSATIIGI